MIRFVIFGLIVVQLLSCKKNDIEKKSDDSMDLKNAVLLSEADFKSSNRYTTTGKVKLYETDKEKKLVFENFKTDNGPDLKVYISKSTSNTDFVDLGNLKVTSGDFYYNVEKKLNTTEYKFVLIWCEDFSVLFGHAQL
jgi:hypothetical protein